MNPEGDRELNQSLLPYLTSLQLSAVSCRMEVQACNSKTHYSTLCLTYNIGSCLNVLAISPCILNSSNESLKMFTKVLNVSLIPFLIRCFI